jgi:hypothetical protein
MGIYGLIEIAEGKITLNSEESTPTRRWKGTIEMASTVEMYGKAKTNDENSLRDMRPSRSFLSSVRASLPGSQVSNSAVTGEERRTFTNTLAAPRPAKVPTFQELLFDYDARKWARQVS